MAKLPVITVTDDALRIGEDEFVFAEVTSVGYVRQVKRATLAITDVIRRFEVVADRRRRSVKLDGYTVDADEKQALWARLVATSQEAIEPRLRAEALDRMQLGGEPIVIGRLTLDRAGFSYRGTLRSRQFPWSEHGRTFFNTDRIRVTVRSGGGSARRLADIPTEEPNAVLLPKLMLACVETFTAS